MPDLSLAIPSRFIWRLYPGNYIMVEEEKEEGKGVLSASLLFSSTSTLPEHPISSPRTTDQSIATILGIHSMAAATSVPMQHNVMWSRLPRNSSSIAPERQMVADFMRRRQLNLAYVFATNRMPRLHTWPSLGSQDTGLSRIPDRARDVQGFPAAAGFPDNPNSASLERAVKRARRSSAAGYAASPKLTVKKARRPPPGTPSSCRRQAITMNSLSSSSSHRSIAKASEMIFDLSIQEQRCSGVPRPGRSSILEFHPNTLRLDWDQIECRTDPLDYTPSDQSRLVKDLFSRRLCQLPSIDLPPTRP